MSSPAGANRARLFALIRTAFGYGLFITAVLYAVMRAPDEIWRLDPLGLALAASAMPAMIALQTMQVALFLRARGVQYGWYWPLLFTTKKGVLNAVLPARTGTLALMYMLTRHYPVKWHEYLRFSLVAAMASLAISGLAVGWLLLSFLQFALALPVIVCIAWAIARRFRASYLGQILPLLLIGTGLFLTMLAGFWGVLLGIGYRISFEQACYFATALNTLAQVSVTPGNMGIREIVMGVLAPYVTLPMTAGIIAGGVFHVVRTSVYAGVMVMMEALPRMFPRTFGSLRHEASQRASR